jgi:photosystem II stability/assembly factor-like uncharacterized protein
VHKTTNGGQSWTLISPDLSTNDSTKQQSSGGVVIDNLFVENVTVLFAIAESPLVKDLIWAGTMDGLLHLTRDGGKTWTNVTANMPGVPKWSTMSAIEPSKYDAGTAYVAVDAHLINDRDPYIYKTTDYGKSWAATFPRACSAMCMSCGRTPCARGCCTPVRRTGCTCRSTTACTSPKSTGRCRTRR